MSIQKTLITQGNSKSSVAIGIAPAYLNLPGEGQDRNWHLLRKINFSEVVKVSQGSVPPPFWISIPKNRRQIYEKTWFVLKENLIFFFPSLV